MTEVALAGVPLATVLLVGVVVFVGAFVQSALGLGLGLLGAPIIALVEPVLVPTMLLILAVPLSFGVLLVDRRHVDWRVIGWALPARVPGTVLGVWLVTAVSERVLGVAVAAMVLLAVGLAVHAVEVRQTPATLFGAGLAAGTSGTAVAVGGPPMAIVMAHRPPPQVRATLSFFYGIGSLVSVAWFAVVGALPHTAVVLSGVFLPVVVVAFALGSWGHRRVPREAFRRVVLTVCTLSAAVLLARSALA